MKRLSYAVLIVAGMCTRANAVSVPELFDFNSGPQYTSLPLDLTVGGVTANFSATGAGFSIQNTAQVIGVLPAGFTGLGLTPNSPFASDLLVSFPQQIMTDFSIMVAPQELATDSSATLSVTAYMNNVLVGTNTSTATGDTFTWPSSTLSFSSPQGFNSVVVHYASPPPTGGDYGVIFVADNMIVTPMAIGPWNGSSSPNWADAANWSGAVPGAVTGTTNAHTALFNQNVTNSPLNIDVGRNVQNITFDTANVNSLTVGTTSGNPLILTSGGMIQTTPTVINAQTVNAPLVLTGPYNLASNAADVSATLSFGGTITPAATSGVTALTLDGSNVGANTITGAIADNGGGKLAVNKAGPGAWTISGPNSYSGNTYVAAGVLRINIISGAPTISPGSIVAVSSGAGLELAGPISALGSVGGNRTRIINDSTTPGVVVSGIHQVVGAIDGTGNTQVDPGSELVADHIIQNALIIGGTATSHGQVTVAASDAAGNPLFSTSLPADRMALSEPFVANAGAPSLLRDLATNIASSMPPLGYAAAAVIPEPTSLTLAIISGIGFGAVQGGRELIRRRSAGRRRSQILRVVGGIA